MSGWPCYACDEVVTPSAAAITAHTDGARHRLRLLGLSAEDAERVVQACHDAGVSHEAAVDALGAALRRPTSDYKRMAAQLRALAG